MAENGGAQDSGIALRCQRLMAAPAGRKIFIQNFSAPSVLYLLFLFLLLLLLYLCEYVFVCTCMCLCMHAGVCLCAHVCICTHIYVCVFVCTCMYVYVGQKLMLAVFLNLFPL